MHGKNWKTEALVTTGLGSNGTNSVIEIIVRLGEGLPDFESEYEDLPIRGGDHKWRVV